MSLICPKCNTTNADEAKFCKNCGVIIKEVLSQDTVKDEEKTSHTGLIIIIIVIATLFFISPKMIHKKEEALVAGLTKEIQPSTDSWYATHTPLPLPETGIIERKSNEGNAPLQIHTRASTGNYFVKIDNIQSGDTEIKAFIRSGEIFSTTLPTGEYEIKYANGENWYDEADLFGPKTSYYKAGETFSFDDYRGYRVELIQQIGGNLQTQTISAQNF